jgi:Fe-S-cluster containining protein
MTFECKEKCGSCCGIVPIPIELSLKYASIIETKKELIKEGVVTGDKKEIYFLTKDGRCVFLDKKKKCLIYDERPMVCRIYGVDLRLPCPYFHIDGTRRNKLNQITTQIQIDRQVDRVLERATNEQGI